MTGSGHTLTTRDAAQALGASALFAAVPPGPLHRLAERAVERRLARGEVVFQRGEPGSAMFLVLTGLLKVYDTSPDGTELVLATIPPGTTVGELALADGGERSASVAAMQTSRVLAVSRVHFLDVLRTEAALAEALMRYLAASLRRVNDLAADLVFLDLPARLARLLMRLAEETGEPVVPGLVLRSLTQSELAAMLGASRQSTNKALRGLVQSEHVALDGRQIRLLRPDLLRAWAR